MGSVLTAVGVIVGLCVLLSLLLIVADALLLDYGECTITINEEDERKVAGGNPLLATLMEEGIFIPSACGGRGSCGLCKVKVLAGGGPLLPTEGPHLSREEMEGNVRISCQVKVRGDMSISVPESILSLRQYAGEVERIVDLSYDTRLIRLKIVEPPEFPFVAGQYLQLETPPYGKTPEPVYRAYSMASPPSDTGAVELIIRLVPNGICTTYVFELLQEGDPVKVNGPYGEFFLRDTDREILFIAGGSGIAPIRSILHQMAEDANPRKATFYYGANELRDLYLVEEMRGFQDKLPDFTYVPVVARPDDVDAWKGESGLVTQAIDRSVEDASEAEAYLCGSPAMIDAAVEVLKGKGLPQERVYYDKFA